MERIQLRNSYHRLNNSFSKKLTFNLGIDGGFFSEINNMVLAILFCLNNKIRFQLYSKKANFALENGWNDFFIPFCPQTDFYFHYRYNRRAHQMKNRNTLSPKLLKLITGNDYLTQDIWNSFRNQDFAKKKFNIPELNLKNATLLESTRKIIQIIWHYNHSSKKIIKDHKDSMNISGNYISLHIRSGDKNMESKVFDPSEYIEQAKELKKYKRAFILTDDYRVIEKLKKKYKEWEFHTLCSKEEKGYIHSEFKNMDKEQKYLRHLKLLASLDICAESDKFIGTFSSNPGMFMGMRISEDKCECLDYDSWVLW